MSIVAGPSGCNDGVIIERGQSHHSGLRMMLRAETLSGRVRQGAVSSQLLLLLSKRLQHAVFGGEHPAFFRI
ncbi:hypothetical protein CWC22_018990 [Pseudoalteromonas rubra]|uniref:Uncharacterized protein n=1 Tax=Pseudoalteromonas rubra TaxID=43658 RepID=A0A7S7YWL5_9GAMM|nr:hypothetical protein [Pseudoalteromonas rubra]QPB84956.1 hypothetical protein CWC22_018990 [Pseudoalteromonas rubra]